MVAVLTQAKPSFQANFSISSPFVSANLSKIHVVYKVICIAHHDDKMCLPPKCRHHSILIRDFDEFLQKLDAFCFAYQHVDCLYTLLKHQFGGNFAAKSGQLFGNVQRAVYFEQRSKVVDRMPRIAKKVLCGKSSRSIF